MKSDVCNLKNDARYYAISLREVKRAAAYNDLTKENTAELRLLADQMLKMLAELIKTFDGEFWVESYGKDYSIHIWLFADKIDARVRGFLIHASADTTNYAQSGVTGAIREEINRLLLDRIYYPDLHIGCERNYNCSVGFGNRQEVIFTWEMPTEYTWTLEKYRNKILWGNDVELIEKLDNSAVAKAADEILVGICGRCIEILIKKSFD